MEEEGESFEPRYEEFGGETPPLLFAKKLRLDQRIWSKHNYALKVDGYNKVSTE
jgi:hypothetical protein